MCRCAALAVLIASMIAAPDAAGAVKVHKGSEPRFAGKRIAYLNIPYASSRPRVRLWRPGHAARTIHRLPRLRFGEDAYLRFEASSRRIVYDLRELEYEIRDEFEAGRTVAALSLSGRSQILARCEYCDAPPAGSGTLDVTGAKVSSSIGRRRHTWLFDASRYEPELRHVARAAVLPSGASSHVHVAGRFAAWQVYRRFQPRHTIVVYDRVKRQRLHRVRVPGWRHFEFDLQADGKVAASYIRGKTRYYGWFGRRGGRLRALPIRGKAERPGRVFIARNRVAGELVGRKRIRYVATRLDGSERVVVRRRGPSRLVAGDTGRLEDFNGRCFAWDHTSERRFLLYLAPAQPSTPRSSACG